MPWYAILWLISRIWRREAKRREAFTIGIANNRNTTIIREAEQGILLDTGAEPIPEKSPTTPGVGS